MKVAKLKRSAVTITYGSDDGFSGSTKFPNQKENGPQVAIINAIDELSRLATLFGFGDEAKAAFDNAQDRVAKWKIENNLPD